MGRCTKPVQLILEWGPDVSGISSHLSPFSNSASWWVDHKDISTWKDDRATEQKGPGSLMTDSTVNLPAQDSNLNYRKKNPKVILIKLLTSVLGFHYISQGRILSAKALLVTVLLKKINWERITARLPRAYHLGLTLWFILSREKTQIFSYSTLLLGTLSLTQCCAVSLYMCVHIPAHE